MSQLHHSTTVAVPMGSDMSFEDDHRGHIEMMKICRICNDEFLLWDQGLEWMVKWILLMMEWSRKKRPTKRKCMDMIWILGFLLWYMLLMASSQVDAFSQDIARKSVSERKIDESYQYLCANGFQQYYTTLYYAVPQAQSLCKICDSTFTCSSDGTYWNNGEISFTNPFVNGEKVWNINGYINFQYDTCRTDYQQQSSNFSVVFDQALTLNLRNVYGGCSCGGCTQKDFQFSDYTQINYLLQQNSNSRIKIKYSATTSALCVSSILLGFCYVSKNVNITDYSISTNNTAVEIDLWP